VNSKQHKSDLRDILGQFATGVAVVTSTDKGNYPIGMTINSFASVSLDPPLILWSLRTSSYYYPNFRNNGNFAISVLSEDQKELCKLFAGKQQEKFSQVDHYFGDLGIPILGGSIAHLECEKRFEYEAGDHVIFVGEVIHFGSEEVRRPLVFHGGSFSTTR
jgi:flavin reductase (DIM6/NTAB) family NADH-FMN oxidoreductase RutF